MSYVFYDKTPTAEAIPAGYTYVSQYAQAYTMGRVVKTKNSNMATWYSYDQMGRTTYKLQQFLDGDYTARQTTLDRQIKALDYTYDLNTGLLSSKVFEKNYTTEKLVHNYYYDADLRLSRVDVGIGAGGPATQVTYSYYKHGPLKRKAYRDNLQGVDYVYNVNGELKSINHPSLDENKDPGFDGKAGSPNSAFAKDIFGMTLDYHYTDYTRSSSNILSSSGTGGNDGFYNGRIHALRWKTRAVTNSINNGADYIDYGGANQVQVTSGTTEELMTRYTYDDQYRLSTGVFGKFNNSTSTFGTAGNVDNYKEWGTSGASGINYDDNGNITNLKRNAYSGTLGINMDNFTYTYTTNTNKLASIVDAIGANTYTDIEATTSKTFSYDNIGRLTASQAESVTAIAYTVRNKTRQVTFSNNNTSTYAYNDNNIKLKTKYFTNSNGKTKFNWFLTDESGQIVAIYEYDENAGTPTFGIIEEHLYAAGRLGILNKTTGEIVYELTDHLGNVRASFKYIGSGNPQLVTRTDYYAFGGPMPGRSYNLGAYRMSYQGQESAVAQSWNNFEFRMYNYDLARFCNPDPLPLFHSPYISMANNPISFIDPNGAAPGVSGGGNSDGGPGNWWARMCNFFGWGWGGGGQGYYTGGSGSVFGDIDLGTLGWAGGGGNNGGGSGGGGGFSGFGGPSWSGGDGGSNGGGGGGSIGGGGGGGVGGGYQGTSRGSSGPETDKYGQPRTIWVVNKNGWGYFDNNPNFGKDPYKRDISFLNRGGKTDMSGGKTKGGHGGVNGTNVSTGLDVVDFIGVSASELGGELAPNSAFTMRGDDVNYKTLFNEFKSGTGPEYSGFGQNHPMTKDMQKSLIVTMAMVKYMAGGGEPLINYDVPFGFASIPLASKSMTEQFIGGARVSIIPTSMGTAFIVNNSTGWYSASYHTGNDISRLPGQITPYGTIYQRFMWIQK